jgi:hypothetical protein
MSKAVAEEGKACDEAGSLAGQVGRVGSLARALPKAHVLDEVQRHP